MIRHIGDANSGHFPASGKKRIDLAPRMWVPASLLSGASSAARF
jgi:hypothetical protein